MMFNKKFLSILLLALFIVQIGALTNQIHLNHPTKTDSKTNQMVETNHANLANKSILSPITNTSANQTSISNQSQPLTNQKKMSTSSTTSTTTASNTGNQQSMRVDYSYDPIYPDFTYTTPQTFTSTCISPNCAQSYTIDSMQNIRSNDGNYGALYNVANLLTSGTSYISQYRFYWRFDITNINTKGVMYWNNVYYQATSTGAISDHYLLYQNSVSNTQLLSIDQSTNIQSISVTNPNYSTINGRNYIIGFFYTQFTTSSTLGNQILTTFIDQAYFQPNSVTTYPLESSNYQGNGRFIDSVVVHPNGSGNVTLYNQTGTIFSTASNTYSSISVSNGATTITGLPAGVDTTVYFTSDQSQNAYSLVKNATIVPDSTNLNCTIQKMGQCSYLTSSTVNFGSANGSLLGNYFVQFNYFPTASSGTIYSSFYNGGFWYNKSLDNTPYIWHSEWVYMSVDSYDSSNRAFVLNSTVPIYIADTNIYSFNYTITNNKLNGIMQISGEMNYITNQGLAIASLINTTFSLFANNTDESLLTSYNVYSDNNGIVNFVLTKDSFNTSLYYFIIYKSNSLISNTVSSIFTENFNNLNDWSYTYAYSHVPPTISSTYYVDSPTSLLLASSGGYGAGTINNKVVMATSLEQELYAYVNSSGTAELEIGAFNPYVNGYGTYGITYSIFASINWETTGAGAAIFWYRHANGDLTTANLNIPTALVNNHWYYIDILYSINSITKVITATLSINNTLIGSTTFQFDQPYLYGHSWIANYGYNNFWIDKFTQVTSQIAESELTCINQTSISYSITENNVAYVLSQDSLSDNLYAQVYMDNVYQGVYSSGQVIYKSSTVGSHIFSYKLIAADNYIIGGATFVNSTYTVVQSNYETIIIRNQQDTFIDPNTFNMYYNSVQFANGQFYDNDTSQTFNLTITDPWGVLVYQNTSEPWVSIKNMIVTMYNVKLQNYLSDPVYTNIQRGSGASFSQWVFPGEVISYEVIPATYSLSWNYASVNGSFVANTNGTSSTTYTWSVAKDIAFRITGTSLSDIYQNTVTAIGTLGTISSYTSTTNQTVGNMYYYMAYNFTNTNDVIGNQSVNIILNFNNTNTTLYQQLISVSSQISNLLSTINTQTTDLNNSINNVKTNVTVQFNSVESYLTNLNAQVVNQTNYLYANITNVNTTILSQTLSILNYLYNNNDSIYNQTISILSDISNVNSTLFQQTVDLLTNITNVNTTMLAQYNNLNTYIGNVNSTLFQQQINILSNITNSNSTIYQQTLNILQNIQQSNSTIYQQTIDILSNITNSNSTIYAQTIDLMNYLYNNKDSIYNQTISILSDISNTNSTLYAQSISILDYIYNNNNSLYNQSISILSSISNTNSTIYAQTVSLMNYLYNNNDSIYNQTVSILADITNTNSTLYTQTITLLNYLYNNKDSIYNQSISILSDILNSNSTIYNQTISLLTNLASANTTFIENAVSILANVASINSTLLNSLAFQVQVNQFYLSDSYVNLYVTSTEGYTYLIYENNTLVGSGSGLSSGTFINYARNNGIGVFIEVGIKFTNATNNIWYNTSYNNAGKQALLLSIGAPIEADGLLQIAISSNYVGTEYYINDSLVSGLQANWVTGNVFAWDVNSSMYGVHSINITGRIDLNGDGLYTATGEIYSTIITWNYFEQDLIIQNIQFFSDFNKQLTLTFTSNYRGQNMTYFRVHTYNGTIWSAWFSEDLTNGSYSFSTASLPTNVKYVFLVQIEANITKASVETQLLNYTFYYIPSSNVVVVVGNNPNPAPLSTTSTTTSDTNIAQIKSQTQYTPITTVLTMLTFIALAAPIIYRYGKKGPAVINKVADETAKSAGIPIPEPLANLAKTQKKTTRRMSSQLDNPYKK